MRVLLVKPSGLSDHIQPPLGLGYLAAAIRPRHEVVILDCLKERLSLKDFIARLAGASYEVVGLQCYTMDWAFVRQALAEIRRLLPRAVTVIGGPHPSADPHGVMEAFADVLDFAFRGEAEIGFSQLLEGLERGQKEFAAVPGLVWRRNGQTIANEPRFHEPLDDLGYPSWDLLRPDTYPPAQHGAFYQRFPIAPVLTSRGCPFRCSFCAGRTISGLKHRRRSIEHIIGEIKHLKATYGIREFHFIDDNFTFNHGHTKALLERIIEERLDIVWATPNGVRLETLDEELAQLMKESGLYLISLGMESGCDRVLRSVNKQFDAAMIEEKVRMLSRHDIPIAGFFVIGFPGETRAEIKKTIRLALRLELVRANFFTFLPFPGTEAYQQLMSRGELTGVDWDRFYFMNAAYVPRGMSRRELKHLQRSAFLKFFMRWRILAANLDGIRSIRHLYYLLRRFYHWIIMRS